MKNKYAILSNGQFGNCLFRLTAAMKYHGIENIDGMVVWDPTLSEAKLRNVIEQLSRVKPDMKVSNYVSDPYNLLYFNTYYWQSLKYIPSREECRKIFNVPNIKDPGRPVIHLRWDDYKILPGNNKPSVNLLIKAAERLNCNIGDFIVCTNDPKFIKTLGIKDEQITYNSPWDDFVLMCSAKKLVIYPSTFSWWAGFLGNHEQVLFPEGFGTWDSGLLNKEIYSAHTNRELCWGEECEMFKV